MAARFTERQALIALNMTQGMGAVTAKNLIEFFGSAAGIFEAGPADLARVRGIGTVKADAFAAAFAQADPEAEEARARKCAATILTWDDPGYPAVLKKIYDPPLVLYVCGSLKAFDPTGVAIISEYPFGREPDKQTFPMRNRIVSGLSAGVLVVEAAMASGTMITVDQALEQGRAVMAVPGRIDSPTSQGCHKLIRNGARLVTCADDVTDELGTFTPLMRPSDGRLHLAAEAPKRAPAGPALSEEEERILAAIGGEERFVDDLVAATGIEAGRLNGLLVALQIKRRVKLLPGGVVSAVSR